MLVDILFAMLFSETILDHTPDIAGDCPVTQQVDAMAFIYGMRYAIPTQID
jgi:hypothetical protein